MRDCDRMDCDEPALLAELHAGRPAWGDAFRCCRERMWKAAVRVLGPDRAVRGRSAGDAVGSAIEEAMRPQTALPTKSLCGWLATIAIQRARDIAKASHLETPTEDVQPNAEVESVDDAAIRALLAQRATELLEDLPASEQHAIRERLMAQRPAKEVAAELGCTPQNLPNVIARGLMLLRAAPDFSVDISFDPDAGTDESASTQGEQSSE